MLKIIGFIFILFSLIITASLFNGVEINEISYKNIKIKKLYLKYDKNLTIHIPKLIITDNKDNKQAEIETNLTLKYTHFLFQFDIQKFILKDTDLSATGTILLDTDTIDFDKKSELTIKNLELQFDTKMERIKAEKTFVTLENNQIDLTFEKVFYKDIDLQDSKVSYLIKTNVLQLYLKTKEHINSTLTDAILRYGIDIPVKQESGKNEITANIFIPFSKGKLFIESYVTITDGVIESYEQKFDISKLSLHYKDLELNGDLELKNYAVQSLNLKNSKIIYNASFKEGIVANVTTDKIDLLQGDNRFILKDIVFDLDDEITTFKSHLTDTKNQLDLVFTNTTNLKEKNSTGDIFIKNIDYENIIVQKDKKLPYTLLFKENVLFNNPTFGLSYFKEKSAQNKHTHKIVVSKPEKLINAFKFLKTSTENSGSIVIKTEDFNETTIDINDLNVDINSSVFQSDKKESKATKKVVLPTFPKLNINYTNGLIKYDKYSFFFDTLKLNSDTNTLNLVATQDKATFDLKTLNNSLFFKADKLSDNYVNTFLDRELLKDGSVDIHIFGEDINLLSGDIQLHETTVKNVTIINSLLTFINTTPAIINPLLALPTLFRMAETGFDTNGYYMKNGDGSFKYNLQTKELQIFDLYTNGKMSNFIVNSIVNFDTNNIYANVDISFLKDFSKAINYIPIIGYVFLGDDGEFHTSVDITGTLDNPSLETHTVKEGTRGVTGVLKRLITLPLKPFQIETTKEQKIEHDKRVEEFLNGQN